MISVIVQGRALFHQRKKSHFNYAPITLWLRGKRPAMERILSSCRGTLGEAYQATVGNFLAVIEAGLPGFGCKVFL